MKAKTTMYCAQMAVALAMAASHSLSAFASHVGDCGKKKDPLDRARCERHLKMFEKCGDIKGPAHHVCDREFLLAHPLDCKSQAGDAVKRCQAENEALQTCKPQEGRAFITCVREKTGESPMGD